MNILMRPPQTVEKKFGVRAENFKADWQAKTLRVGFTEEGAKCIWKKLLTGHIHMTNTIKSLMCAII